MNLASWGNYPKNKSKIFEFDKCSTLKWIVESNMDLIAYGNGRSYGDSALSRNTIRGKHHNFFLNFDQSSGLLHVQAGVVLSEILDIFVPKGWFLSITPGTKLITVGGAIASDVHGKNHHLNGCFSEYVKAFTLMLSNGKIIRCSKQENADLFKATCGGMGLTGIIIDVEIFLKRIESKNIIQTTIQTSSLNETFQVFENYSDKEYIVAWIDCLAKGNKTGKCLITSGTFSDDGELGYQSKSKIKIPFNLPSFIINRLVVKIFNFLYYCRIKNKISNKTVSIDTFFYPLDSILNWNKLYGRNGFIQYQFVLPKKISFKGLEEILNLISKSGFTPSLAVLKLFGPENNNFLSFPIEGYTLAVDFKIEKKLFKFLEELDKVVVNCGGRIYLAKDARVNKKVFESGYPEVNKFRSLRQKYNLEKKFNSLQSRRLEI
jgi:decaprenylphospho-beta-D-ribofuranose 2-oxidase